MANRRMFAKTIIDSDAFLEMKLSTQLLYFHLAMRADDDGFINNPKSIVRICGSNEDDIKTLAIKKFIIPFESGVVVIKHWKIHNYIAKDRYTETKYKEEKEWLELDENNSYRLKNTQQNDHPYTERTHVVHDLDAQYSIDKISKEKNNNRPAKKKKTTTKTFKPPTIEELTLYINENNYQVDPNVFHAHYETVGWLVGKNKMKDWKAAVRGWHARSKPDRKQIVTTPQYMETTVIKTEVDEKERQALLEKLKGQ